MQAYYMAAPFAVERAPTVALCCPLKHRTVHVALLKDYPVCSSSLTMITKWEDPVLSAKDWIFSLSHAQPGHS